IFSNHLLLSSPLSSPLLSLLSSPVLSPRSTSTLLLSSSLVLFSPLHPPLLLHLASGDEDEDEAGEERLPSCFDYVMHFLTVFWKVLFACVPPTDYWNGWACFIISIVIIGFLTAVIGDLASHFGCTIGLKDSVTAVVFVALGTSVPVFVAPGTSVPGV
ncbi:sodium/calcium exchanger 3-like, partial [Engraulis encrasicolus]|uniref:sodium/calcium exchanger 3-like n=1 Tax=Engraulis encrasicolus TaxID=184585 RepID=UPI002FD700BF